MHSYDMIIKGFEWEAVLREFEQQAPIYGSDWDAALHNGALSNESVDNVCPFFSHYALNFSFHKHILFFENKRATKKTMNVTR